MRQRDPVDEILAETMEMLTRRPHVHAAAFVWDHSAPIIVRARRPNEGALLLETASKGYQGDAKGAQLVTRVTGAHLAAAKVNGDGTVWMLFDALAATEQELDALRTAAEIMRMHLDELLGPAEVGR